MELGTLQFFSFQTGHGEQDDILGQSLDTDATEAEKLVLVFLFLSARISKLAKLKLKMFDIHVSCNTCRGMRQAAQDIAGRYPVQHYWDAFEPKLLVCQAHLLPAADTKAVKPDAHTKGSLLTKSTTEAKVCDTCT